jgi:hypothetical protein
MLGGLSGQATMSDGSVGWVVSKSGMELNPIQLVVGGFTDVHTKSARMRHVCRGRLSNTSRHVEWHADSFLRLTASCQLANIYGCPPGRFWR